VKTSSWTMR